MLQSWCWFHKLVAVEPLSKSSTQTFSLNINEQMLWSCDCATAQGVRRHRQDDTLRFSDHHTLAGHGVDTGTPQGRVPSPLLNSLYTYSQPAIPEHQQDQRRWLWISGGEQQRSHTPLQISRIPVERVRRFNTSRPHHRGPHLDKNTDFITSKARQHHYCLSTLGEFKVSPHISLLSNWGHPDWEHHFLGTETAPSRT